jgi:hypothetical protein
MIIFITLLILFNFAFVGWFGAKDLYLIVVKYYRLTRRYFDPEFMTKKQDIAEIEDIFENPIYQPFNVIKKVDLEVDLDVIEEVSLQQEDEEMPP